MGKFLIKWAAAAALLATTPAVGQVDTVDPNQPYQTESSQADPYAAPAPSPADPYASEAGPPAETPPTETPTAENTPPLEWIPVDSTTAEAAPPATTPAPADSAVATPATSPSTAADRTVPREDVFTAAEDLFGRGAEGLAGILENILRDQGEPTAYIAGQEAGGAFIFGVRYGSGTMHHQIEGDRAVYWTGPSLGFDIGADANKVFVLVYNLHDSQDLFKRFPGAEGRAYFVGGFTAQYLRRGDIVLVPIRLGVGMRLGVNAGYMRFTERNRWVPF